MLDAAREAVTFAAAKTSQDLKFGMRHRLIHVYFDVDLEPVCDTIAVDLPPLIANLEKAVEAGHK